MSKIITKAAITAYSPESAKKIQARLLKYAVITGESGGVQRIQYFYPAPSGNGYATIAGADRIGGKNRINRAIELARKFSDHPAAI
jgi:hypothetical protein